MPSALIAIVLGIFAWAVYIVFALATGADAKYVYTALVGIALGAIGIRYTLRRGKRGQL